MNCSLWQSCICVSLYPEACVLDRSVLSALVHFAYWQLAVSQHRLLECTEVERCFVAMQASGHMTRLEATLTGSICRLQLDNQLLEATQPVVLASASVAHARSDTAQSLVGDTGPLISFGMTRSFANTIVATGESNSAASNPAAGNKQQAQTAGASSPQSWSDGNKMGDNPAAILSFKDIHLKVGEMDFQADDGFLEAILSFVVSIPTADIWQDEVWREQQRRLLTAQFGPKEVESLVTNTVLTLQDRLVEPDVDPLQWVQQKELRELEVTALPACHRSSLSLLCHLQHSPPVHDITYLQACVAI